MKSIIFFISCLSCAVAQNVAIAPLLSRPEHEFNGISGCPTNWPVIVDRIGVATNSPHAGRTVITEAQLAQLYATVGPTFTNWHQTTWADYVRTNAAANDARRLQLLLARAIILNRLNDLTNAADFTSASAPLIVSNWLVLRRIEDRLEGR